MKRRDLLLQSMGITQWELAKPQVLKGDAQICLDEKIRLVVICEENQQQSPFFQDLRMALMLQESECYWATSEQLQRFTLKHQPFFLLFTPVGKQLEKQLKKMIKFPSWQALQETANKRELWKQLDSFERETD